MLVIFMTNLYFWIRYQEIIRTIIAKLGKMKLEKILDNLGSLEKNAFIKIIDNIISKKPKNIKEIEKILSS